MIISYHAIRIRAACWGLRSVLSKLGFFNTTPHAPTLLASVRAGSPNDVFFGSGNIICPTSTSTCLPRIFVGALEQCDETNGTLIAGYAGVPSDHTSHFHAFTLHASHNTHFRLPTCLCPHPCSPAFAGLFRHHQYDAAYRSAGSATAFLMSSSAQRHPHTTIQATRRNHPHRSRPTARSTRPSYSPDRDELDDSNGVLSTEDLRDRRAVEGDEEDEEDELEEDGGVSPHPLDNFADLGIASRAPSRRGSPKPSQSHQRYKNSAIRTSPPSRAHSPPPSTLGHHQQHVTLPPPTSLLSQTASRSSSSGNVKGVAELSALSMLASSELYELERKEREREEQIGYHRHHQHQQEYCHPPYPHSHLGSGAAPGSYPPSLMTPPAPPSCRHEYCQRSYRMALSVYQQSQAPNQIQNSAIRATAGGGFPRRNDAMIPHDDYVSFPGPGPAPDSSGRGNGGVRGDVHPASPGSTDSSELSRSPPMHIRHNPQHQHQYNPYARPSGKLSHPGTPRGFTPATSPVLAPMRSGNHHYTSGSVPVPTMLSESAVRGDAKDDADLHDEGMDIDMR